MTYMRMNMSFIQAADAVIKINETIQSQNIKLCEIGHENNLDDINKKYINPDLFNLLDMLAVLMKTRSKLKLNPKAKNAKIVQRCVEKEKQYTMPRILHWNEYIDASRQVNLAD